MRKAQKQEVLEMIQTLHQAHDEIKNYVDRKNYALAQDILSQCQECAISIGTAIEKLEGEGFVTVSYVETYCDVLFSIYEELNGVDANANKVHKNLKKQLLRIENSVKNDVPVRKEIAFFPYKASMWDALESVYLAAKEDPDCDVYCVPIPYYDKKPDRSLGQMHYEGREYPKNIEVIDWETYNFEERNPDVIYIHNPYDDWNLVTSVHPRFYSFNLKKHTEKLVYIPYFVLGEIEPHEQEKIEKMKHFCFLPGVINADKVIVQSENMKQIYVNEYLKAAQANNFQGYHVDRKKLEEKFLGLGSPKFDKVQNTKKEDLEIPDEWLKIIEKPDGSWKKIIFYNTSIGALLEHNEKMLQKMRWVFNVFKENKDEVALLWRPHPLIKTTIESMRPQLWIEYDKLVKQYKEEGWGIYDDSADLDRAVVLSDAYYGDQSSVVQLCQKAGMPVMIQNVKMKEYDWNEFIFGKGMCIVEGDIWIPMAMTQNLIRCNGSTGNIEWNKKWGQGQQKQGRNYWFTDITCVENMLYLAPTGVDEIWVYDMTKDLFRQIPIDISTEFCKTPSVHARILKTKEQVFFIGVCHTMAIVVLDRQTERIKVFGESQYQQKNGAYGRNAVVQGDILYVPLQQNGAILCVNCKTGEEQTVYVDKKKRALITICEYNQALYVTTQDGQLLEIVDSMNTVNEIALPNKNMFFSSFCVGETLWLFPFQENELSIRVNLRTKEKKEFRVPKRIYDVTQKGEKLLLNARGCVIELDEKNEIREIPYSLNNLVDKCDSVSKWIEKDWKESIEQEGNPEYLDLRMLLDRVKKS